MLVEVTIAFTASYHRSCAFLVRYSGGESTARQMDHDLWTILDRHQFNLKALAMHEVTLLAWEGNVSECLQAGILGHNLQADILRIHFGEAKNPASVDSGKVGFEAWPRRNRVKGYVRCRAEFPFKKLRKRITELRDKKFESHGQTFHRDSCYVHSCCFPAIESSPERDDNWRYIGADEDDDERGSWLGMNRDEKNHYEDDSGQDNLPEEEPTDDVDFFGDDILGNDTARPVDNEEFMDDDASDSEDADIYVGDESDIYYDDA
jgi:hypothetical protein